MRNFRSILFLLVILIAVLPAQAQVRDGRIAYGESVDGRIEVEEEFKVVAFTGSAGDVVNVTVTAPASATLDPVVYILYGEIPFSFNDDAEDASVGAFNSQLKNLVLPQDGTYDLYITGYSGTGDFTVSVEKVGSLTEIDAFPIALGEVTTGTLDVDNNFFFYAFEANAGEDVSIYALNTGADYVDTSFILYDSELFPLAIIDDNSREDGDYDAVYEGFILPDTGTYYLVVTRFEGAGQFELTLSSSSAAVTPSTSSNSAGSELAYGASETGYIDATTSQINYTFTGSAGDVVTITMVAESGSTLDSVLRLLDASGSVITENDDAVDLSLGRFNSQIVDFTLPASGEYTIVATRFSGDGNFTVSLDGQ